MWRRIGCLFVSYCAVSAAGAATWYVAPTGRDSNSGASAKAALRTIQAGLAQAQPGDVVEVANGVYRETVVFPRSGEPGRPITVRAAAGAEPLISGCDPVVGFRKGEGQTYTAPMHWTLGTGRNQVFAADGSVLLEARHPNRADPDLGMYVAGLSPLWPTFGEFSLPKETLKEQPGRIVSRHLDGFPTDWWKGALYYGVHYEGWAAQTGIVESSKPGEITVGDRTGGWWFGSAYGGGYSPEEGRGMVVGHLHALDAPGEWHWQDNTLHLIPRDGKLPQQVEAKRRQLAMDLSGRSHLVVQGLRFKAASLRLADSSFCTFERCHLSYLSHYLRHYSIGQIEHGRDTIKSGETGIYVSGHDNRFLSCSLRISAGAGFYLRGYHHTIHNCVIDEVSYTAHYLNAITDAVSDFPEWENFLVGGHVITYNTMRNAGRHFFNFYGNGTSTASRDRGPMDYMATLFAHNHLYNGMLQTKDAGLLTGYYSSGGTLCGLNSQVCYNVLHDTYDTFAMRIGALGLVYLDAGSCDVDLWNNLLWAAPGSLQRGLWYNTMCVDVHERDNLFHPQFTRTAAQLVAKDFPAGKPFRFGHDWSVPPPLPNWPQLDSLDLGPPAPATLRDAAVVPLGEVDFGGGWQTAVFDFASASTALNTDRAARQTPRHTRATDPLVLEVSHHDALHEKIRQQWTFMYNVPDGGWIRYNKVPLGAGYRRLRVVYGVDQAQARSCEVRLDAVDGPLVGTVALPPTDKARGGRIQIYQTAVGELSAAAQGTHDLFLVFRSPDGTQVGEFEYFRLEQARAPLPLQPNEVQGELRLDSPQGELLGVGYPRGTGGAATVRPLVANLEPARGKHALFLVTRAAVAGDLGRLERVRLWRAKQPLSWQGVGLAPRQVGGKPVYPTPTNRPIARPGDKYPARTASARANRPVAVARRLTVPVTLDGTLADWPTADPLRGLALTQEYDGQPAKAPASTAWLAYDAQALYIAQRHPVGNAPKLLPSSHTWGADDGCEVAFQSAAAANPGAVLTLYGYPDGKFAAADYGGATARQIAALQQAVQYRAAIGVAEWTCEWRIPFAASGWTPQRDPLWSFNLGVRKTAPLGWVIWQGTGGAAWQVGQAGLLAFADEVLAVGLPPKDLALRLTARAADVQLDAAGRVELWRDRVAAGRVAQQARPEHRPRYIADGLRGQPTLHFDEQLATRLELPDLSDQKMQATVAAVFSNPVAGSEVNHDPRILTASDGKGFDYQVGIAAAVPGMTIGGPRVGLWAYNDVWGKVVRIGCFSPNPQTFFTGDLSELLLYRRALTPAEQDQVRAYLSVAWNLP
ncbi:MAG: carbohydrate-binding protein [Fimbriimonadaceae bacterium]|nr:carbohydrate-binding protein [Fimbriimonadaceae bacterium]